MLRQLLAVHVPKCYRHVGSCMYEMYNKPYPQVLLIRKCGTICYRIDNIGNEMQVIIVLRYCQKQI